MNEEEVQDAIKRAAAKFGQWEGRATPAKKEPLLDHLPWSSEYGPHICPRCRGTGWLVKHNDTNYPDLVACESCDKAASAQIARSWKVSNMLVDVPSPPTVRTFEKHSEAAAAVHDATSTFVRSRWGWLTLYGSPGTGKSHISEAIARWFLTTNVPCVFTSSMYLWEYLGGVGRGEHDDTDYGERFRWIKDLEVLVIDEFNVEKSTEFVFRTRRSLLDYRYKAALDGRSITVLVSNDAPADWQDAAIADRALDSRFVAVNTGTVSYRRIRRDTR